MVLLRADVRKFRGYRGKTFVPKRHGMEDAVGFCCRSHLVSSQLSRKIEGVAHNAIRTPPREYRFLHDYFMFCSGILAAADLGVLTFRIFADDPEIDITRIAIANRRLDPRE